MKAYVIADLLAHMERDYNAQGKQDHADAIRRALSIIRQAGCEDEDPISEPARGQLFPLLKQARLSLDDLKNHLLCTYGITSTKAIPWGLFDEICAWLIAQAPAPKHPLSQPMLVPLLPTEEAASTAYPASQEPQRAYSSRHRSLRPRTQPHPLPEPLPSANARR